MEEAYADSSVESPPLEGKHDQTQLVYVALSMVKACDVVASDVRPGIRRCGFVG